MPLIFGVYSDRITSYINNLHPLKEKPLYCLIEGIIDACIPLWNFTLAPVQPSGTFYHQLRIEYFKVEYPPKISESQSILKAPSADTMDVDPISDESMGVDSSLDESTSDDGDEDYGSEGSDPWGIYDSKVPAMQPEPADFFSSSRPPRSSISGRSTEKGDFKSLSS